MCSSGNNGTSLNSTASATDSKASGSPACIMYAGTYFGGILVMEVLVWLVVIL